MPPKPSPLHSRTPSDDLSHPLASPPYRALSGSVSQVHLDQPLPAYHGSDPMIDYRYPGEKSGSSSHGYESPRAVTVGEEHEPRPKPTRVHYPSDVYQAPPVPSVLPPKLESRASSVGGGTDDEHDEQDGEDYDWSGEEDLEQNELEFEQKMGVKSPPKGWGIKRIATMLFSSLIGSTFLAILLITPAVLLNYFWYQNHPETPHRRWVKDNVEAWLFWAAANILVSWYLAMLTDIVPALVRFLIAAGWGHVSENVKTRIELYDSVKDTIKPLLYAASAWVSWVILFQNVYGLHNGSEDIPSAAAYTDRVAQSVEFAFFLALVVCGQQMLSHVIAFAFHRTAYKERIDSVRSTLAVIEALRNYHPKPSSHHHNPFRHHGRCSSGVLTPVLSALGFGGGGHDGAKTPFNEKEHFHYLSGALSRATPHGSEDADADIEDEDANGTHGKRRSTKGKEKRQSLVGSSRQETMTRSEASSRPDSPTPSTPPYARPGTDSLHRYPPSSPQDEKDKDKAETTALAAAVKVLKTAVLHDARNIRGKDSGLKALAWNVNSAHDAKRLAKAIYHRFNDRRSGRTYLLARDFAPAFTSAAEAEAAFRVFDRDGNGDISRPEIKAAVLKVYKERRFLSRSMRDVGRALKTLDQILLFLAFVILFFISLSVFGVQVASSLTSIYSIGIGASFIFKNAASNAFDAIMFCFVTHPFDTGDRVFIDDENFVVKKMGLFATVFTRADGTETYYFNSLLFTKFITNVRRSGKMFENLTMQVAWRTPLEKLDQLEKRVNEWLQTEENRWFETSTSLTFQTIDLQRHLVITMAFGHNGTWQDWGLRMARKTAFHAAVQYYCQELGIVASGVPIPIEYVDSNSDTWIPSTPSPQGVDAQSPSPSNSPREFDLGAEVEVIVERKASMRNVLGFTPPNELKPSELTRARGSRSRKTALRTMGAAGG